MENFVLLCDSVVQKLENLIKRFFNKEQGAKVRGFEVELSQVWR